MIKKKNIDLKTAKSFGEEWEKFDQSNLSSKEALERFNEYFHLFPWDLLPAESEGIDIGCGSGRWDKFVAPRVFKLHCVEPAERAITVAKRNLSKYKNIIFHQKSLDDLEIPNESMDFCYSLGVLHHVPDTLKALEKCASLLKPGAPFLGYLYYNFENKSKIFKLIWKFSDFFRKIISKSSPGSKNLYCDLIAIFIYLPITNFLRFLEIIGFKVHSFPLSYYRNYSFYTMRTDARDRFGTPVEKRFSQKDIIKMCEKSGFENIVFSDREPFWCFTAIKRKTKK